ncbi:membrane-associated protein, putative [Bodo saltans]|uniref:Membrane-associated protein, putative n=1 Tax=Bodo saltans TaxID=75058 RepID=A0A0S4JKW6_BODSA|nr:membrane-associated protein, putative [Bodo saltans]|eukprot:CUG90864.1 membrane-associated protein, putative [Bodo saltans]
MLRHAPVTTACLGIVVVSSTALSSSLLSLLLAKESSSGGWSAVSSWWALRLPLSTFPVLPFAPSGWIFLCLLVFLFHSRQLERQWGSPKFLTYIAVISLIGRFAAQLVIGGLSPSSTACRLGYLLAAIVPISALATRLVTDLPAVGKSTTIFHPRIVLSAEKVVVVSAAALVIFFSPTPPIYLIADIAQGRHAKITEVVGYGPRVALCLGGIALGLLTRRASAARRRNNAGVVVPPNSAARVLNFINERISKPIVERILNFALSPLCGPVTSVEQFLPERLRQQQRNGGHNNGGVRAANGRGVGALAGDNGNDNIPQEVWDRIIREQQELNSARSPNSPGVSDQRRVFPVPGQQQQQQAQHVEVDPTKIVLLRELQLGVSDDLIAEALIVTNGDVDAAVAYLCEGH